MSHPKFRLWLALVPAMVVPCAASLFYFVFFSEHLFARAVYGAAKVFTLAWPVVCVWFVLGTRLPRMNLRDPLHRKAIPFGVLSGIAIVVILVIAMHTAPGRVLYAGADALRAKATQLGFLAYFVPFALFLSLMNSLIEEYYWRWFVFGRLREVAVVALACLLAGVSFAAHHVVLLAQFFPLAWAFLLGGCVGIGGVLWSLMYHRQGTLAGAWVSHMIVDIGLMWVGYNVLFADGSP